MSAMVLSFESSISSWNSNMILLLDYDFDMECVINSIASAMTIEEANVNLNDTLWHRCNPFGIDGGRVDVFDALIVAIEYRMQQLEIPIPYLNTNCNLRLRRDRLIMVEVRQ